MFCCLRAQKLHVMVAVTLLLLRSKYRDCKCMHEAMSQCENQCTNVGSAYLEQLVGVVCGEKNVSLVTGLLSWLRGIHDY